MDFSGGELKRFSLSACSKRKKIVKRDKKKRKEARKLLIRNNPGLIIQKSGHKTTNSLFQEAEKNPIHLVQYALVWKLLIPSGSLHWLD